MTETGLCSPEPEKNPNHPEKKHRDWHDILSLVFLGATLLAAALAAFFTGRQAYLANKQLRVARDNIAVTRDQERRQLRAYVVVNTVSGMENFQINGRLKSAIVFENVGQTPVYDGKWLAGLNVRSYLPAIPNIECAAIAKSPQGFVSFFGKTSNPEKSAPENEPLTEPVINEINAGISTIYFIGRFCYQDIFRDQHWTDFCVMWTTDGQRGLNAPKYCLSGNDGDRTPAPP
jgi:hypothetical protein